MERPSFESLYAKRQRCRRDHDLTLSGIVKCNNAGCWHLACRQCINLTRRAKRAARRPQGLVLRGQDPLTANQIRARLAVATKRARYGDRWDFMRRRNPNATHPYRTQTHCKRGHEFTAENTYLFLNKKTGWRVRICRQCTKLRQGLQVRPSWLMVNGVRVSVRAHDRFYRNTLNRLKHRQMAAHPDKGGTSAKFIKARKALERFQQQEAAWYASVNLQPPTMKRRAFDRAASFQRAS